MGRVISGFLSVAGIVLVYIGYPLWLGIVVALPWILFSEGKNE